MVAPVAQLRIARAHAFERRPPDHEKAGAGVADLDEAALFDDGVAVVDLHDVAQRRRGRIAPPGLDGRLYLVPVDPLDRIDGGAHVGAAGDEAKHLLGLEADIGVDEEEMGRGGIVEKLGQPGSPAPA